MDKVTGSDTSFKSSVPAAAVVAAAEDAVVLLAAAVLAAAACVLLAAGAVLPVSCVLLPHPVSSDVIIAVDSRIPNTFFFIVNLLIALCSLTSVRSSF